MTSGGGGRGQKRPQALVFDGVDNTYEDRDSELLCPVCLDFFQEPYMTLCGHSFCHTCIIKSLNQVSKCPRCNLPLPCERQPLTSIVFPNVTLSALMTKNRQRQQQQEILLRSSSTIGTGASLRHLVDMLNRGKLTAEQLHSLQELLKRQQSQLDDELKLSETQLLAEFLQQLRTKKQQELDNVHLELRLLDKDLKTVESLLGAGASGSGASSKDLYLGSAAAPIEETAFNATSTSLSMSQRRVRLHSHFEDLEGKYWSLRKSYLTKEEDEEEGRKELEEFRSNLNQLTRYESLRPLANLSYGSDLLNTAHIVSSIEFDKDADFFAIAGVTKRIKVYDYASVVRDAVVDIHYPVQEMIASSKISCVSWSCYHKSILASSDYEGTVSVWDAAGGGGSGGVRLRALQEHEKRCWSVDFNRVDSHLLASGSDDSRVKIWSLNSEHSVATLEAKANVCCVKFNPFSRYCLAYGAADHCVHYVDLRQPKEPLHIFKGHRKAVSYVKFLSATEIVSASTDSQLKLWSTDATSSSSSTEATSQRTFRGHTNEKNFVGLSTSGGSSELIACGSENNALYLYCKGLSQPLMHYKFDVVKSALSTTDASSSGGTSNDTAAESVEFISAVCWKPDGSDVVVAANSQGTVKVLQLV